MQKAIKIAVSSCMLQAYAVELTTPHTAESRNIEGIFGSIVARYESQIGCCMTLTD